MVGKLTDKQEMFCQEYLVDLNATQAAIRAGYSEKTAGQIGEQNLKKLEIASRVKELMDDRLEKINVSQDWVLLRLIEISDRCTQAKPVQEWDYVEKKFKNTGEYEFDSNGAIKATELIGKHIGMFDKKKDDTDNRPVNVYVQAPEGANYIPLASDESEIDMNKDERYERKD